MILTTPANVPDQVPFIDMLDCIPPITMPSGQSRYKPSSALGDRAYGTKQVIGEVAERDIDSLLAPRSSAHGSGLGAVRYVIEQTMSWMGNYRRIKLCYERKPEHFQAFNELAACLILLNRVRRLPEQKAAA